MKQILLTFFIICLFNNNIYSAGTCAGTILKYSPGVRQQSLAECGSALAGDFDSVNYNPAVLPTVKGANISMLYDSAFDDAGIYYLGIGKAFKVFSVAAAFLTFQGGRITINDRNDELDNKSLNAQTDYVFSLTAAKRIFYSTYFGITPKFLSSTIVENYTDSVIAVDSGIFCETGIFKRGKKRLRNRFYAEGIKVGIAVRNIGGKLKNNTVEDPLPLIIRGGISYPMKFTFEHFLLICSDVLKSNEDDIKAGVGVEYINKDMFFLRLGYNINYEIKNLTWGIGIKYKSFGFDYGMLLNSAINNRNLVTVSLSL